MKGFAHRKNLQNYSYTTNLPFSDDYASLHEIIQIIQSDTLQEKLSLLFAQHNEHRLVFSRIIFLLVYSVCGEIDFKILVLIGNSALLGLLFFAYKTLPEKREKITLVFPAALLLFQLKQNWIHMMWGLDSLSNLYVLCFSGLTFYFLGKGSIKYFWGAWFFALCSVLTQGSGVGTLITGWILLLIQKRFKLAWVWGMGILLVLVFYFHSFNFSSKSSFMISSLSDLAQIGNFFISFLGAMASFENRTAIFTLGILIVCYFIFLVRRKYYAINPAVFGFMVYVIIVAAMVALNRSGFGENAVFADRYKIVSLTMVLLIYISVVDLFYSRINRKWVFAAGMIVITGSMYLVSYIEGKQKLEFARDLLVWRTNQWLDKNFNLMAHHEHEANTVMTKALTGGFYKLPHQFINIPDGKYSPPVNSADLCVRESEEPFDSEFNVITVGPESSPFLVRIEGMIYDRESVLPTESEPVHVILGSREGRYMFTAHSQEHVHTSIHFRPGRSNRGLLALIPINKLNNNIYRLGLCYRGEVVYSNQLIIKQDHQFKIAGKTADVANSRGGSAS
ncbi:hypothetical protein UZ36_04905 [Candidatus Nitromaritima sp. SCGC AAA799-C22]|nr:hypothetical protein UZ36_04905 [Candidatus Nitromaritima sp. SCGC AAA799-C22]